VLSTNFDVQSADNNMHRTPFRAADGDAETQCISHHLHTTDAVLSATWYGRTMLITASVDFVYISRPATGMLKKKWNLCVRTGKPEAELNSNKKLKLLYC